MPPGFSALKKAGQIGTGPLRVRPVPVVEGAGHHDHVGGPIGHAHPLERAVDRDIGPAGRRRIGLQDGAPPAAATRLDLDHGRCPASGPRRSGSRTGGDRRRGRCRRRGACRSRWRPAAPRLPAARAAAWPRAARRAGPGSRRGLAGSGRRRRSADNRPRTAARASFEARMDSLRERGRRHLKDRPPAGKRRSRNRSALDVARAASHLFIRERRSRALADQAGPIRDRRD